jgi:hypothetical protein
MTYFYKPIRDAPTNTGQLKVYLFVAFILVAIIALIMYFSTRKTETTSTKLILTNEPQDPCAKILDGYKLCMKYCKENNADDTCIRQCNEFAAHLQHCCNTHKTSPSCK